MLEGLASEEETLPIDQIVQMRYYIANFFYGRKKIELQYEKDLAEINAPSSNNYGIDFLMRSDDNRSGRTETRQ